MDANEMDLGGNVPADDVFGDVPADPLAGAPPVEPGEPGSPTNPVDLSQADEAERLGGVDPEPLPESDAPSDEGDATPDDLPTPVEETPPAEEPAPESEPAPEPEPTPEPPAEAKGTSDSRTYMVLEERVLKDESGNEVTAWVQREPESAHNGDGALRKGYRAAVEAGESGDKRLVVVAETFWKPRTVKGRPTTGMAIDID